jgi:MtN3 and saliva related transmembrane protein
MLENFVDLLAVLATIFGIVMSSASFPQTFKIFRRKSSADVSLTTYLMLLPGATAWLLYGIGLGNMPLIITNIIGLISCISVIIVYFVYKK